MRGVLLLSVLLIGACGVDSGRESPKPIDNGGADCNVEDWSATQVVTATGDGAEAEKLLGAPDGIAAAAGSVNSVVLLFNQAPLRAGGKIYFTAESGADTRLGAVQASADGVIFYGVRLAPAAVGVEGGMSVTMSGMAPLTHAKYLSVELASGLVDAIVAPGPCTP